MSLALAFWIVLLTWLVGGGVSMYVGSSDYKLWLPAIIPFLLFLLLGIGVFGAPIKG